MKKILLAGVLGGVVNFAWGAFSHMVIHLGDTGVRGIPNQDAVLPPIKAGIRERGFYFFPWVQEPPNATKAQKEAVEKQWGDLMRAGPSGILVVDPRGKELMSPSQLLGELASNILGAAVAAHLLCKAAGGISWFGGRVLFCALLGLFASLAIDVSYWNWYGFPTNYTAAALVDQVAGWGLAGVAIGAIVRKPAAG